MDDSDNTFEVGGHTAGPGSDAYLVADCGINHDGRPAHARRLVRQAAAAGADAVLFRVFRTDALVSEEAETSDARGAGERLQRNMLGRRELPLEAFRELSEEATDRDLRFLTAPRDRESLSFVRSIEVDAIQVEPGDLTHLRLLRSLRDRSVPVLLSTGLADMGEIDRATQVLASDEEDPPAVLLYGVTLYPATPEQLDLQTLTTYANRFDRPVGFRDRTTGHEAAQMAVALGASVIQKGLTLDRDADGPEHRAALEPEPFHEFVKHVRSAGDARGAGEKSIPDNARALRASLRRSLAVRRNMAAGERISEDDLAALRPASGLPPSAFDQVTGRHLATDKRAGELLHERDLTNDDPS